MAAALQTAERERKESGAESRVKTAEMRKEGNNIQEVGKFTLPLSPPHHMTTTSQ